MPLPYYHRLSRRKQGLYRRSVALAPPEFEDLASLREQAEAVKLALGEGSARRTRSCAARLLDAMCAQLQIPTVALLVEARRPDSEEEQLHGLYEREEDESATITVWMRTSARGEVVKFRTFMRTLLHELVHHLDYDYYELEDSLHTEGFFKRESALLSIVAPRPEGETKPKSEPTGPEQLRLF